MTIVAFDNLSCARRAMARRQSPRVPNRSQRGFMLLEVLVSILLFALGFIALMGMEGRAIADTSYSQDRAEAVQLANAYVAQIWSWQGTADSIEREFSSSGNGPSYQDFKEQVQSIPGAQAPTVTINNNCWVATNSSMSVPENNVNVIISIKWIDKDSQKTSTPIVHEVTQATNVSFQPSKDESIPLSCQQNA
jgi:type IV pilus assembly protein PilV